MIVQCPYCQIDTGGSHEYDCPNNPRLTNTVSAKFDSWKLEQYVIEYAKICKALAETKAENERLRALLTKSGLIETLQEIEMLKSNRDINKERYNQLFIDFVERGGEIERLKDIQCTNLRCPHRNINGEFYEPKALQSLKEREVKNETFEGTSENHRM